VPSARLDKAEAGFGGCVSAGKTGWLGERGLSAADPAALLGDDGDEVAHCGGAVGVVEGDIDDGVDVLHLACGVMLKGAEEPVDVRQLFEDRPQ